MAGPYRFTGSPRSLAFIVWIIGGASTGAGQPANCEGLDAETCNAAADVGTGIGVGVALIVVLWLVVDFLVAVIYGMYRASTAPCPHQ